MAERYWDGLAHQIAPCVLPPGPPDARERAAHNPYLAYYSLGCDPNASWQQAIDRWSNVLEARRLGVARYAWAVPNDDALRVLAAAAPLIEIGAGRGYWAHLLRRRGVDIRALDRAPSDYTWTEVAPGGEGALLDEPARTLFLCWPDRHSPMAAECLAAYRGTRLLYVGEWLGGCCADDDFFLAVHTDWRLVGEVTIPQWPGMHDTLVVCERRDASATGCPDAHDNSDYQGSG